MSTPTHEETGTAGREIVSTRAFDFSLEQVWEAWTNPVLLAQWWGPNGFTNTFAEFDLRPDGHWRFVMHGPDGRDYQNHSIFREITYRSRIVFDHVAPPCFQVTATFTNEAGKTRVTFRMLFDTVATCDAVKGIVVDANEQNFDRFAAVLGKMDLPKEKDAGRELVLTRIIDLPRELLFKAWTTRFTEWWGPHGMTTPFCEMDLRTGGVFRTLMRAPDGSEYPTKGVFLEVVDNERIVFTDAFGPGWEPSPEIFFTAITTFEALPDGKTRYTARALHWTAENRKKHEKMGFHQGWGESLDRLVICTSNLKK
ncbi:MAG: SRPBCC domain-containing protein [Opitutaceae bacterium]|jgi:uncharacterized protein YndB with AHSA1/START domain